MNQINEEVTKEDWYSVVARHLPNKLGYIVDPGRMGWLFHCYDPDTSQVCLDIGSGWGSLTFGLHHLYDTVYSQDGVFERLQFQALRAESEGVDNIRFIRSNFQKIPLPDKSVDLVVMNGVLEWVAIWEPQLNPGEMQIAFLEEIKRVLKPKGLVYLGIENRFGAQYFLGAKDHSGCPFTSLVPRSIANLMLGLFEKIRSNKDSRMHVHSGVNSRYRTYTYTKWGYQRMFSRVGFPNISILWAWPGYSYPRMSGTLDGQSIRFVLDNLGNRYNHRLIRFFVKLILLFPDLILSLLINLFSPNFLIFAGSDSNHTAPLCRFVNDVSNDQSFVRFSLGINMSLKSTFVLLEQNEVAKSVQVEVKNGLSRKNNSFSTQEALGINGHLLRSHNIEEVTAASEWLKLFQQQTSDGIWKTESLRQEIATIISRVQDLPDCIDLNVQLKLFEKSYLELVSNTNIPIVTEHGDYSPPNIIVDSECKVHIIDWEHSRKHGNPLFDVGAFSLSLLRSSSKNGNFPLELQPRQPVTWFFQNYNDQFSIPVCLSPTYYLLRVISRIKTNSTNSPRVRFLLSNWSSLLKPALDFSLNVEEPEKSRQVV
jgi:ubiquinone/menaquinone biosynthesis C-methylase UbiE